MDMQTRQSVAMEKGTDQTFMFIVSQWSGFHISVTPFVGHTIACVRPGNPPKVPLDPHEPGTACDTFPYPGNALNINATHPIFKVGAWYLTVEAVGYAIAEATYYSTMFPTTLHPGDPIVGNVIYHETSMFSSMIDLGDVSDQYRVDITAHVYLGKVRMSVYAWLMFNNSRVLLFSGESEGDVHYTESADSLHRRLPDGTIHQIPLYIEVYGMATGFFGNRFALLVDQPRDQIDMLTNNPVYARVH